MGKHQSKSLKEENHELLNKLDKVDKERWYQFVKENCYHGADPTDEHLEKMLQALHRSDEKSFIEEIINLTDESSESDANQHQENNLFYTVQARHSRFDRYGDKGMDCPNLKGKAVNATFNGTLLVKNYRESLDELPDNVAVRSIEDVKDWAKSVKKDCLHPNGVDPFRPSHSKEAYKCFMENPVDRSIFVEAVKKIDWGNVTFDVYASVPLGDKKSCPIFSPAFNSLWMIYAPVADPNQSTLKLWLLQAAFADGTPATGAFGLSFDTPIISRTGIKFSPFADPKNFYRITLKKDPLTINVESFYHKLDPQLQHPYIVVSSIFEPATKKEISKTTGENELSANISKTTGMICKGAIVEKLLSVYYPKLSNTRLFSMEADPQIKGLKPLSLNDDIVGNLLATFNFFETNRDGIWIHPPTIEDADVEASNRIRKDMILRQQEARKNLLMRLNDLSSKDEGK